MEPKEESPDAVLLRFVERLPTTIRDIVLARCCTAFGRLQAVPNQDLFATFRAILTAPERENRAYVSAKMAAVLELALHEDSADAHAELARDLYEMTRSPRFENLDLDGPLPQKHWRAAREEFRVLRREFLTVEALHRMVDGGRAPRPEVSQRP
ncbi:MAG TPA: hypothetical protein VF329_02420 [Gammaproteobacteria bacterium]